jgi:hypothetical protein
MPSLTVVVLLQKQSSKYYHLSILLIKDTTATFMFQFSSMSAISEYSEARERWTWRNQVMNDGTTRILSNLRVQLTCMQSILFVSFLRSHTVFAHHD